MKGNASDHLIEPDYSFYYERHQLTVDGLPVSKLMEKYGSPLYVYSGSAIRESYRRLSHALKGLPVQICYAVKANSNIHILKLLSQLGAGCDLVSYGEWYRAELARVPRNRRVLSGVAKTAEELDQLLEHANAGVSAIHVESVMEFELIHLMATLKRKSVVVAFRYNPDVDAKTLDKISTGRRKDKFGLTREEILDLCVNFNDDEFVRIAGISIHIGSQITQAKPYDEAFSELKDLCEEVETHLGRALDYVDLGGGLGIQYENEKTISLSVYAKLIKKYFSNYPKILIEPGRSLIANAGALLTEVVYSKVRTGHRTLILDSGMNDLIRPAFYDAYHEIVPVRLESDIPKKAWDVVGGICETSDYFARGRKLAAEGTPCESFAILSSGAYGFSMSNTYNTRPRLAEVLVDRGKATLIRKRETLEDLVRHER